MFLNSVAVGRSDAAGGFLPGWESVALMAWDTSVALSAGAILFAWRDV